MVGALAGPLSTSRRGAGWFPFRWIHKACPRPSRGRERGHRPPTVDGFAMFDHDLDQTLLLLFGVLAVTFLFPFAMAWLEDSLATPSPMRSVMRAVLTTISRAFAKRKHR